MRILTSSTLLLLFLLPSLASCSLLCPSDNSQPTADSAVATVTLILDVHADSAARYGALDEAEQNRIADAAWMIARAELPPAVYRALGTYRVATGEGGWPIMRGLQDLANPILGAVGLALDDPPKGCQRNDKVNPRGSIKCDWFLRRLSVPRVDSTPIDFELGCATYTQFIPTRRLLP